MESSPIDQEMDEMLQRLAGKSGPATNAYGTDPLASDHLLLKQSWGFFKRRVATIEQQWREITEAKTEEIVLLKKQISAYQERLHELESDKVAADDFLRAMEMSRLEDHELFRKDKNKLIQRWEEERIVLESDRLRLEQEIKRKEEKLLAQQEALQKLKKESESLRQSAREVEIKWVQSQAETAESLNQNIVQKDELFQSEQLKSDLLRREVERRDQLLAESSMRERDLLARVSKFEKELSDTKESLDSAILDRTREHEDAQRLMAERERMLADWQREKAEWRELWERSRSLLEKRSS